MVRKSWLDGMIENFQHRWETNPQYRATMSGVLGIVFLVFMCSCVSIVSIGANTVLNSLGFGSASSNAASGDQNTGSQVVHGAVSIPIATVTLGTPQAIPQTTLLPSGTPLPTPTTSPTATATATATPCTSNCGGGGGGKKGTISGTPVPATWIAGANVILHIHSSAPNIGYSLIINLPGYAVPDLKQPTGRYTDGSGNDDYPYTVPSYVTAGTGQITITGADGSGGTALIPCQP